MSDTGNHTRRVARRWPLWLIATSAAVSIWAGWVGLGGMCGFGLVHPLPGIADSVSLNTAITLPVGMEAYAAYALGAWLSPRALRPVARTFARRSALGSLGLGLLGQAVYHLLTAFGSSKAPWPVVLFVAALPVLVLGAGATLHHLLATGEDTQDEAPDTERVDTGRASTPVVPPVEVGQALDWATSGPDGPAAITAGPGPGVAASAPAPVSRVRVTATRSRTARTAGKPVRRRLFADYLDAARAALAGEPGVDPSPAWCRRVSGCSQRLSTDLAKALRAELHTTGTDVGTDVGMAAGVDAGTALGTEPGARRHETVRPGTHERQREVAA
jgi:hypothetical protein